MVWLPDGEKKLKIRLLVLTEFTNVTDGQTDGRTESDGHRMKAKAALARQTCASRDKQTINQLVEKQLSQ